jgi:CheY-like chemotaxis protein
MAQTKSAPQHILLVEDDVIVRLGIAEHLRDCGFVVLEASGSKEARVILLAGPPVDILLSDAQLAGADSGFALAQWIRRYRPNVKVLLTSTTSNKVETAGSLCSHRPRHEVKRLEANLRAMMSARARRKKPPAATATGAARRKIS